jgi:hypothetical protein
MARFPGLSARQAMARRSPRLALEIVLQIVFEGSSFLVRTVLVGRDGVLVHSPRLCPLGSTLEATNPANGRSARLRVVWARVEKAAASRVIRLALEGVDPGAGLWAYEYERRLREVDLGMDERRQGPRTLVRIPLEIACHGRKLRAETIDISDRGAGILLEEWLEPGTSLRVTGPGTERAARFRVVWAERPRGDRTVPCRAGIEMQGARHGLWSQCQRPA